MIGAFLGAVQMWLTYLPHWRLTEDPATKLAAFCTAPAVRSPAANIVTEVIGTAMLLFGVLAIGANAEGWVQAGEVDLSQVFSRALQPLLVVFWCSGLGCRSEGAPATPSTPRAISGRA